MTVSNLLDLYTDYFIFSPIQTTSTGFSSMLDNSISHDKMTRLLSSNEINSKKIWYNVKPMCHEIQEEDSVLIIDDSIEEKNIQIKTH